MPARSLETSATSNEGQFAPHPTVPRPDAATQAWAVARLAAVGLASPVLGPAVAIAAYRNTQRVRSEAVDFPARVHQAAKRDPRAPWTSVRLPSAGRYLITSDLHRAHVGWADWPSRQGTDDVYPLMLEGYAADRWTLIENGDVEELWMGGGSRWGMSWDVRRAWAARPATAASAELTELLTEQLQHTYAHHDDTYRVLTEGFLADDRYFRTTGNHDDDLARPEGAIALDRVFPGLKAVDVAALVANPDVVLETDPDAVILHGHQIDAWNGPGMSSIGRLSAVVGSALHDLPGQQAPGLSKQSHTLAVLEGVGSRLIEVSPIYGADTNLNSTDEVLTRDAWRDYWRDHGFAEHALDGPVIVMGHTHLPGCEPDQRSGGDPWRGYLNSGSGITPAMVTAIEWDAAEGADTAEVRLVAWRDSSWSGDHRVGPPKLKRTVISGFEMPLSSSA